MADNTTNRAIGVSNCFCCHALLCEAEWWIDSLLWIHLLHSLCRSSWAHPCWCMSATIILGMFDFVFHIPQTIIVFCPSAACFTSSPCVLRTVVVPFWCCTVAHEQHNKRVHITCHNAQTWRHFYYWLKLLCVHMVACYTQLTAASIQQRAQNSNRCIFTVRFACVTCALECMPVCVCAYRVPGTEPTRCEMISLC